MLQAKSCHSGFYRTLVNTSFVHYVAVQNILPVGSKRGNIEGSYIGLRSRLIAMDVFSGCSRIAMCVFSGCSEGCVDSLHHRLLHVGKW